MKKLLLSTALLTLAGSVFAQSQSNDSGDTKERIQYTLLQPEEKTPELVKPEENNPFEPASNGTQKDEGTSEENQVRDILLRLPAVGGASGPNGMRVMLGGMRLVAGGTVPPVVPDQQVALKVKSITPAGIELIWVEKKPSGLPPKVLMIPMDGAPKVRYRLPNNGSKDTAQGSGMGSIRRGGISVFAPPLQAPQPPSQAVASRLEAEIKKATPADLATPATASTQHPSEASAAPSTTTPPPSNVPEASVLRMLFGNHPPAGK